MGAKYSRFLFAFLVSFVFSSNAIALGIATLPAAGAVDVGVLPTLTVAFSDLPDASQVVLSLSLGDGTSIRCNFAGASEDRKVFAFLPERRLQVNSTYTATLSSFKDIQGNAYEPHVWTFGTREKDWTQVGSVGAAVPGSSLAPNAAINSRGDTIVAWEQDEDSAGGAEGGVNIYVKATVGETTVQPTRLNLYGTAGGHKTAINENGDVFVVWQEQFGDPSWEITPSPQQIFLVRRPALGEFAPVQWVNSPPDCPAQSGASEPEIVLSKAGNKAFVVWGQSLKADETRAIYAASCDIQEPACRLIGKVSDNDGADSSSPSLAAFGEDGVVFVWQESEKFAVRIYSEGSLGEVTRLGGRVSSPSVAGTPAGDVLLVWQECAGVCGVSASPEDVYSVAGAVWNGAGFEGAVWIPAVSSKGIPTTPIIRISSSSRDAFLVWQQAMGETEGATVFSSSFNLGAGWPMAPVAGKMLMASGLGSASPKAAISDSGFELVLGLGKTLTAAAALDTAWTKNGIVFHQMLATFGGEVSSPDLSISADGRVLAVWKELTPDGSSKIGAAMMQ